MSYHKNGSEGNNRVYNIDSRLTEFSLAETVVACYAKAHLARQPIFLFRAMYERRLWVKKIAWSWRLQRESAQEEDYLFLVSPN